MILLHFLLLNKYMSQTEMTLVVLGKQTNKNPQTNNKGLSKISRKPFVIQTTFVLLLELFFQKVGIWKT